MAEISQSLRWVIQAWKNMQMEASCSQSFWLFTMHSSPFLAQPLFLHLTLWEPRFSFLSHLREPLSILIPIFVSCSTPSLCLNSSFSPLHQNSFPKSLTYFWGAPFFCEKSHRIESWFMTELKEYNCSSFGDCLCKRKRKNVCDLSAFLSFSWLCLHTFLSHTHISFIAVQFTYHKIYPLWSIPFSSF